MTKRNDKKPSRPVTRRTIIKGSTSLGIMLAAGVAPARRRCFSPRRSGQQRTSAVPRGMRGLHHILYDHICI